MNRAKLKKPIVILNGCPVPVSPLFCPWCLTKRGECGVCEGRTVVLQPDSVMRAHLARRVQRGTLP